MYDTLIRNALIIDGSNSPGYPADLVILNGRIERIELAPSGIAWRTI